MKRRRDKLIRTHSRRAALVLVVMVCLLLVTMIGGSLMKVGLTHRRQTRHEQIRQQAVWLAESAVERAVARSKQDAEYSGEEWVLAGTDAVNGKEAMIRISVTKSDDNANRRIVTVVADYPRDNDQRVRISKQVAVDL